MHFPQSTMQPKATMTAAMPANPPPGFPNPSSHNNASTRYMESQSWSFNNPLFFQPNAPRSTPTPNPISSETPKHASNNVLPIMPSSTPFPQAMPTPDWQQQQQSQSSAAGPSKLAAAWNASVAFPSVNFNTGNRFSELLEEKLGIEKQRNQQFNNNFFGANTLDFDFTQYNYLQPPNTNPGMMPSPNPSAQSGPGLYSNNLLAVENALHDLSQVMIPPDLVAPLPQAFLPWSQPGSQDNGFSLDAYNPPGLTASALGSALSLPDPNFTQPSPCGSSRNSPKSNQSAPAPGKNILTGPYTWTASAKAYEESLPPVLKIRVHSHESDTSAPPLPPQAAPSTQPPPPGTWAMNLVSHGSEAWPSHSPSASSVGFVTPRMSNTKIPTPPASVEVSKSRKRQRTSSDALSSPAGSNSASRNRMSASASFSASLSAGGGSSSPQPEGSKDHAAASGADTEGDGEEKKVIIACYNCRAKKLRCDGDKPKCHHCKRRGEDKCEYDVKLRRRGPGKKNKSKHQESGDNNAGSSRQLLSGPQHSLPSLPPSLPKPPTTAHAHSQQQLQQPNMGFGMMPGPAGPGPMGFMPMTSIGYGGMGVGVNGGYTGMPGPM